MARFEVLVPAAPPRVPTGLTLRLDAEHWLGALKTGLARLGEANPAANILCDFQADGSIHVTDPDSGRVFRIAELPAGTPVTPLPAVPPLAPARPVAIPSSHAERVVEARTPVLTPSRPIGRITMVVRAVDVQAELALEVSALGRCTDRMAGLDLVLDAAMRAIACEAGSVFTASEIPGQLSFTVVRGPTADTLRALDLKVPFGVGIVGFCAQENVALAVSDVEKDPRFYRAVSQATGYQTRSLLCAPMARPGRVLGCLELLNKRGGRPWDQKDLAVLSHLAAQAGVFLERVGG